MFIDLNGSWPKLSTIFTVVAVAAVTYAAEEIIEKVKEDAKVEEQKNEPIYFAAERNWDDPEGGIHIQQAISKEKAIDRIRKGRDIYTPNIIDAFGIAFELEEVALHFMMHITIIDMVIICLKIRIISIWANILYHK